MNFNTTYTLVVVFELSHVTYQSYKVLLKQPAIKPCKDVLTSFPVYGKRSS